MASAASGGYEKTFTSERTVPFPPSQLFQVVADVGKYQEFVPYCVYVFEEMLLFCLVVWKHLRRLQRNPEIETLDFWC